MRAQKRGGEFAAIWDELENILPAPDDTYRTLITYEFQQALGTFIKRLPKFARIVFLRRYWYCQSIADIASDLSCSPSKVTAQLFRTRKKLHDYLKKEELL
jgi:RNA polymerase sigma-70 factor (ECF subfamily)